ncbi:putative bifunctional diguanylate cyclase/phosphodiesterase [Sphingobium sp. KCTC 72723]|uniref:putative bifunctional diguanylate cyclase/phosphodiesterase n=1 Tax=Sphingobium sp. KCTC 72723 TaxID=2733867 RepID=UPI00165E73D7|nr:EAL domain-containing protein [Sphingobium sp. KCTC 72723]
MKHVSFMNTRAVPLSAPHGLTSLANCLPLSAPREGVADAFIQQTADPVLLLNAEGSVLWANASALAQVDAMHVEGIGRRWEQVWANDYRADAMAAFDMALAHGRARFSAASQASDEVTREWDVTLTQIGDMTLGSLNIIALAREVKGQDAGASHLRRGDLHDALTGLPNRMGVQQELHRRTSRLVADGGRFALAILDIDGFKQLNSRLGQKACDAILIEFANTMAQAANDHLFVARVEGDQFALLVDAVLDPDKIVTQIERLIQQCADRVLNSTDIASFSVSAGVTIFPNDGETDQELLQNARTALEHARRARHGKTVLFNGSMRQQLQRHSSMLEVAKVAIASDWIKPYYQPKVDLQSGRVIGLEALLRWQRPGAPVELPASILAAFDDPELATCISERMQNKVLTDIAAWKRAGSALPVAINASAADFRNPDFAGKFLNQLYKANIPTHLLELEVTEGVFLGIGAADVGVALRELNAAGVRISLDDFGTGYASLSHLKEHPVDILKIDRSFVNNLPDSPDDRAIVSAMIGLGRNLAIEVVAEGIETMEQATLLRDMGCHTGQGFLFSRAIPGALVPHLTRQHLMAGSEPQTLPRRAS